MGLLDGKVAIVTGAGGGLGREHALALAAGGAAVVVNDLGGARDGTGAGAAMADKVVDEIKAAGGEAAASYDNVATVEGGEAILKSALDAFGQVDILVNNAGILRDKSFAKTTEDLWDPVIAVHLKGTYCVTRPVFLHMKERGQGGVIINTSSTSGLNGNFGQCNYGAAKAGIAGFTRCLALEGQRYGIRCHILAPVAHTRLTEDLPGFDADAAVAKYDPKLVSPLLVYLSSDDAKELTGKTFFAGGGRIAEMKVVTAEGISKEEDGGLWTPEEIAARMTAGEILLPES
ncbi:MAG: SDR family NAD(P)-dependent oxidoreductase [Deltaproteobacteria bacterium]|jgi:NAD(P)-dependent dehydrogenase (short-subunit alcohol dehydrogenase family)|nr:SDR family NAD(P)-dependent oxidoreductase [Deltaproteobacteria bacterium]MBW2499736.1 SDR family NAD(P)-dependent oxidoreductase [Deltaproteobacteria bacterium]